MKKLLIFSVFISKIINSFPYAVAQLIFYGIALAKSAQGDYFDGDGNLWA